MSANFKDVFVASIVCVVGGFALTVYACARWLPPLAPTPVADVATWVVRGLAGLAGAWTVLHVYDAGYGFANHARAGGFAGFSLNNTEVFENLVAMLPTTGTLIASAAIVYLLAPRGGGGGERAGAALPRATEP